MGLPARRGDLGYIPDPDWLRLQQSEPERAICSACIPLPSIHDEGCGSTPMQGLTEWIAPTLVSAVSKVVAAFVGSRCRSTHYHNVVGGTIIL